jgi:hypothetical protein
MQSAPSASQEAQRASHAFLLLRFAVGLCFIGHGAFGILGKQAWLPYFDVIGISEGMAWRLMPFVGCVDIAVGVLALIAPTRAGFAWAALWALWTAALRPLAGESIWELLERAGNYGVPIAILAWAGFPRSRAAAFERLTSTHLADAAYARVRAILLATTFLLLIGHGGFGVFDRKPLLGEHYAVVGMDAVWVPPIGAFEMALALLVLMRPVPSVLLGIAFWKIGTEALYPLSGAPVWEFVERGGSYLAPAVAAVLPASARLLDSWREGIARAARSTSIMTVLVAPFLLHHFTTDQLPAREPGVTILAASTSATHADTTLIARLRERGSVLLCRHTRSVKRSGAWAFPLGMFARAVLPYTRECRAVIRPHEHR